MANALGRREHRRQVLPRTSICCVAFGLAQERAESAATAAEEYGFAVWMAVTTINRGWARVAQGHDEEEGAQEIRLGLAGYETTEATLWRPHFLGLVAQALAPEGRVDEGLGVICDDLALVSSCS